MASSSVVTPGLLFPLLRRGIAQSTNCACLPSSRIAQFGVSHSHLRGLPILQESRNTRYAHKFYSEVPLYNGAANTERNEYRQLHRGCALQLLCES